MFKVLFLPRGFLTFLLVYWGAQHLDLGIHSPNVSQSTATDVLSLLLDHKPDVASESGWVPSQGQSQNKTLQLRQLKTEILQELDFLQTRHSLQSGEEPSLDLDLDDTDAERENSNFTKPSWRPLLYR